MALSNNLPENIASQTEQRLESAIKIASLKVEIEKYWRLAESASASSVSRTEMRLTAAIKIAALKMEIEKYRGFEESAIKVSDINAVEQPPIPTLTPTTADKNECHQNSIGKDFQEPAKTKMSESDWVNEQARKLLGGRGKKKRFTIK